MKVSIRNKHHVYVEKEGINGVSLFYNNVYQDHDIICIEVDQYPTYLWVKVDDAIDFALVYIPGPIFKYKIPNEIERKAYNYKAFYNNKHLIKVRKATEYDIYQYQNLTLNPIDLKNQNSYFPHVYSSEDGQLNHVFEARNSIDGLVFNESHGRWPYTSWSFNKNEKAELIIEFGRDVDIDKVIIYLRVDFDHDNYFKRMNVQLSNQKIKTFECIKTGNSQIFALEEKDIQWIKFTDFELSTENSPFAAITQIEVYGYNKRRIE